MAGASGKTDSTTHLGHTHVLGDASLDETFTHHVRAMSELRPEGTSALVGSGLLVGCVALLMIFVGLWCNGKAGGTKILSRRFASQRRPTTKIRTRQSKERKKIRPVDEEEGTGEGLLGSKSRNHDIEDHDDDENTVLHDQGVDDSDAGDATADLCIAKDIPKQMSADDAGADSQSEPPTLNGFLPIATKPNVQSPKLHICDD
ncbi:MAG: hypothetical protein SGPRY_001474 [Prymnesium sp.]